MAKEIGTEAKRKVLNMGSYLVRRFLPRKLPRSSDWMRLGEEKREGEIIRNGTA
jgi:hypothetical protein